MWLLRFALKMGFESWDEVRNQFTGELTTVTSPQVYALEPFADGYSLLRQKDKETSSAEQIYLVWTE